MLKRRTLTASVAAGLTLSSLGLPIKAKSQSLQKLNHPLFATVELPNIDYREICPNDNLGFDDTNQDESLKFEIINAINQYKIAEAEHIYLKSLRDISVLDTFDMLRYKDRKYLFSGDVMNHFSEMILDNATHNDNALIISPTSLVILQASSNRLFKRINTIDNISIFSTRKVGSLDKLSVVVDPYASDRTNSLIGYISPDEYERKASLVQMNETSFKYGNKDDYRNGWKTIGIETNTLSFI